jgi:hypothetical protein
MANPSELRGPGRVAEPAAGRVIPRRARSPPCYRNIFRDEDESCFSAWRAQRGSYPDSRYM